MKRSLELIIFIYCFYFNNSQDCPYFKYAEHNGATVGRLEFQNDHSGNYKVEVNMTAAAYLQNNANIKLEMQTSSNDVINGHPLVYFIYFPIQNVLPRPTKIQLNSRIYCTGAPEQVRSGVGVTNFWATTSFTSSQSFQPQQQGPAMTMVISNFIPQYFATTPIPTKSSLDSIFTQNSFTEARLLGNPITAQPVYVQRTTQTAPTTQRPIFTQPATEVTQKRVTQRFAVTNTPKEECGFISSAPVTSLIVKGDNVDEGQFPWMSALMYRLSKNSEYEYKCTGSLVSNQHIVTAAHCIQYEKALLFALKDLLVVFGRVDIEDWHIGSVTRPLSHINVHPDYKSKSGDCDIAVFTLAIPVRFTAFVKPICIWNGDDDLDKIVGTQGTVAGWGSDETGKVRITEAKYVRMPIVSQVECLLSNSKFRTLTSNRTFCAGNRNGAGPCNGDSGAGFIIQSNDRWTLRGVVSRSLSDANTCDLKNYFVFADAAKVSQWLREAVV